MNTSVRSVLSASKKIFLPLLVLCFSFLFCSILFAQPVYQWAKSINSAEWSQNITRDVRGNIYLCGLFGGSSDFNPGPDTATITTGERNYYFAKYDPNGNYIFAFAIQVPYADGIQIAVDQSSNIYLTGLLTQTGSDHQNIDFDPGPGEAFLSTGDGKIFVAKYDSSGNYLWAFALDSMDDWNNSSDYIRHIAVDKFGDIYLTGQFFGTVDFDPGPGEAKLTADSSDAFLVKYDTYGNYLWARKAGGKGDDGGIGVVVDNSGSAYISGWTDGSAVFDPKSEGGFLADTSKNFFFAKYDSTGKFWWVKSIRRLEDYNYSGLIALDSTGNIYFSANFDSTLVDVDPGPGVSYLPNGGRFIGKYDNDGQYIWAKSIGGPQINDLEVGVSNNIYAAGIFNGTNYFEPGNDLSKLTSFSRNVDMFVAKYDPDGEYQWVMHCGTSDTTAFQSGCILESMTLDPSENIYVAGYFGGTTDFDPGPGVANLTTFITEDIFFAKYSQLKSSVGSQSQEASSISIFPNPSSGLVHIQGTLATPEKLDAKVFNILGAEVLRQTFDAPMEFSLPIDVSKLPAGVYTVELTSQEGLKEIQFVKE